MSSPGRGPRCLARIVSALKKKKKNSCSDSEHSNEHFQGLPTQVCGGLGERILFGCFFSMRKCYFYTQRNLMMLMNEWRNVNVMLEHSLVSSRIWGCERNLCSVLF